MTESFCKLAGFSPKVRFENNHSDTFNRMLRMGLGVGFIPQYTSGALESEYIKTLKIESPLCVRTINVCWPENKELSPSALLFKDFVKRYFKENFSTAASR
jgi:DNA-binding transcriptional LysR family regulator